MIKKITISSMIALIIASLVTSIVFAGSTLDRGQLEDVPPVGEANYTAWLTDAVVTNGAPEEVMTEDAYNSGLGSDLGYALQSIGVGWRIQVRNFEATSPDDNDSVSMIFGGMNASSGKLWTYSFIWDDDVSITNHPLVPLAASTGEVCPSITEVGSSGSEQSITFSDRPNSYYHIFKSTLASGAGNELSNGRYQYLDSVYTNEFSIGTYTDNEPLPSWYIVIRADDTTGDLVGCHSEEANPTDVRMINFTATYHPHNRSVEVAWETASELNILGFNVWRSTSESGDRMQLNNELKEAKHPGEPDGDTYTYDDFEIALGETYYYWIEIEGLDNIRESVGPQSVDTPYTFYMPFVQ